MSKKIIFFGNERFATGTTSKLLIIKALVNLGYDIEYIVLSQKDINKNKPEIIDFAINHHIKIIYFENNESLYDQLSKSKTEFAVLASFGRIIPAKILDLFSGGIINIHPSLLPLHRGPTPLESVILEGQTKTGISIIKLVLKMDSGPIYAQEPILIKPNIHKQELADMLDQKASELLSQIIDDVTAYKLDPIPQSDNNATYDKMIFKKDSLLNPLTHSAIQLERQIRAHEIWPRSLLKINGIDLIVLKAHVLEGKIKPGSIYLKNRTFGVGTIDGLLIIDELLPLGKNKMSSKAFLAGYKDKFFEEI